MAGVYVIMGKTNLQAKNIPDQKMLEIIHKVQLRMQKENDAQLLRGVIGYSMPHYWATIPTEQVWANLSYIREELSDFPPKVVLAKLKSMVKRGLIHGCTCGCRGDFYPV